MTHIDAQADPPADPLAVTRRPFRVAPKPVKTRTIPTDRWQLQLSPFDFLFGLVVVATSVAYFRLSDGLWFSGDDWPLATRGGTLGDFLEPYNKHLSISIIAIYRVAFTIFGFDTYVAVANRRHRVFRRGRGRALPRPAPTGRPAHRRVSLRATCCGSPALGLAPALLNHYLAVLGGVVCAWALMRDDRTGDWVVAGGLAFALIGAGGGISVIAACFVHAACTRARLVALDRGRGAVGCVADLVRGLRRGQGAGIVGLRRSHDRADDPRSVRRRDEHLRSARVRDSDRSGSSSPLRSRRTSDGGCGRASSHRRTCSPGPRPSRSGGSGSSYSRGVLVDTETFRYLFVGAVFIVLAMIPPTPLKLPDATRSLTAAVAVALAIGVVVLVNRPDIVDQAERDRNIARTAKMMVIVANQGPAVIPDSYQLPPFTLGLNGKQYREVIDRWGYPPDTRPRDVDARLVELADIRLVPVKNPAEPCTEPNSLAYAAKRRGCECRRARRPRPSCWYGSATGPTRIGDLGPNQTAIMTLPGSFPIGPGRSARRALASHSRMARERHRAGEPARYPGTRSRAPTRGRPRSAACARAPRWAGGS